MVLVSGIFGVSQWNFGARTVHPYFFTFITDWYYFSYFQEN